MLHDNFDDHTYIFYLTFLSSVFHVWMRKSSQFDSMVPNEVGNDGLIKKSTSPSSCPYGISNDSQNKSIQVLIWYAMWSLHIRVFQIRGNLLNKVSGKGILVRTLNWNSKETYAWFMEFWECLPKIWKPPNIVSSPS